MKDRSFLPEAVLLCATEQLLILPLTLSILILARAQSILMCFLAIFLMSCAIMAVHLFAPKKLQPYAKALVLLILGAVILFFCGFSSASAFAFSFGVLFVIRAHWIIKNRNNGFSFYTFVVLGIIFYLVAALLYGRSSLFAPYAFYLAAAATLAIIGSCLCAGITHIGYERRVVNKISKIPKMTRFSNTFLLAVFIILVLIVAALGFIDHLGALLGNIWNFLKNIVSAISDWYESLFKSRSIQPDTGEMVPQEALVDDSPIVPETAFSRVLRIGGYYAVLAFISLALAFILYMLLKRSRKFFMFILGKLSDYFKQFMAGQGYEMVEAGYEDEVTSLLKEGESSLDAARRWLASNREPLRPYALLQSNSERIRWLYKRKIKRALNRGMNIKAAMTPTEVLKGIDASGSIPEETICAAADAYNTARYGSRDPDDSAVNAMRKFYSAKRPRV